MNYSHTSGFRPLPATNREEELSSQEQDSFSFLCKTLFRMYCLLAPATNLTWGQNHWAPTREVIQGLRRYCPRAPHGHCQVTGPETSPAPAVLCDLRLPQITTTTALHTPSAWHLSSKTNLLSVPTAETRQNLLPKPHGAGKKPGPTDPLLHPTVWVS